MAEAWLSIIGLNEDGLAGLTHASREALAQAEIVFGAPRHLALAGVQGRAWGVPFSVAPVLAERGRRVVVLASGDPFWHGAGGSLVGHLTAGEWVSHPAPSTFQLAANRLGWRMEEVVCLGLHAAPLARLRPGLAQGQKLICLLRDGAAVGELAAYMLAQGFGASTLHVLEALGGARERVLKTTPQQADGVVFSAPIAVAIDCVGKGLPRASGLPDDLFAHDGQITKRAIRALTLSALAPRGSEVLWDLGTGSGSISIEFLLAAPGTTAHAVEADAGRAARALTNAEAFGLGHRWHLHRGAALEHLAHLPRPDGVFVGGGASDALLAALWAAMPAGARLVMNAVTLETEALLYQWHGVCGGHLMRIDLAEAGALGSKRGWDVARPVVQWSVVR
jgi:precorrin-6Y C5,15-methyltransferase (decarboxylating)